MRIVFDVSDNYREQPAPDPRTSFAQGSFSCLRTFKRWRQLCPGRSFAIRPLLSALFGSLRNGTDNCGLVAQQGLTRALQCPKWCLRRTAAFHAAYHSFDLESSAVSVAEASTQGGPFTPLANAVAGRRVNFDALCTLNRLACWHILASIGRCAIVLKGCFAAGQPRHSRRQAITL